MAASKGKKSRYTVFISYSRRDAFIASTIAAKLRAMGIEVWLDARDVEGGDPILERILAGIDACHEAVVLISQAAMGSQWVAFEIGAVCGQHKRVTPVLNNVEPNAMAPLRGIQAIDLNQLQIFFGEVRRRLEALTSGE
ncbi:MAG TPA: toll/interleukin-1 receptor domain-containing protein [Thermoanaerobaculia bacterium]|nr:toll/interleukin-1 receptor domain-containing protein [Thermoanaerobaculia bacterium]